MTRVDTNCCFTIFSNTQTINKQKVFIQKILPKSFSYKIIEAILLHGTPVLHSQLVVILLPTMHDRCPFFLVLVLVWVFVLTQVLVMILVLILVFFLVKVLVWSLSL